MPELSLAVTDPREVAGLARKGMAIGADRSNGVRPCIHMVTRQTVRTYGQRQTDESERSNPVRALTPG